MKKTNATLAIIALTALLATLGSGAQAQTQWGVSISLPPAPPAPISQPSLPIYIPPVPQPFPATTDVPDPQLAVPTAPLKTATQPPSIEQQQAQQHARIQWGWRAGLISHRELRHLQSLQSQLEHQRYGAYSDGWLTADEQQSLYLALNNLSTRIEHSLNYGHPYGYVPQHYAIAPLPLIIWNFSGWQRPHGHAHSQAHGHVHGHGQAQPPSVHQQHHTAPRPPVIAVPTPRPPHQPLPRPFDPHRAPPK